jgi:hypothetical protein
MRLYKVTAATRPSHTSPCDCVVAFIVVALGDVRAFRILMAGGMSHTFNDANLNYLARLLMSTFLNSAGDRKVGARSHEPVSFMSTATSTAPTDNRDYNT